VDLDVLIRALGEAGRFGPSIAAWSVYAASARRLSLGTKDGETGNPHAPLALSESLTGRYKLVWEDGRVSRGAMERRAIEREPEPILRAARAASYDDPDGRDVLGPATFPDVPLEDAAAAAAAAGDVSAMAPRLAAIRGRVARHGIRTWSGSMQASAGIARVVTSAGLDVEGAGTSASWSATLDGELGAGHGARSLEPASEFEARLDRLIAYVLALRSPASTRAGGVVPVLLHPDVVEDYVLGVLLHNLEGAQVAHGTGAFGRAQFGSGTPVLREDLTLRTDPLVPMAGGAYRFTQEGLPARACTFVERGCLVTPLLDLKYARRIGLPPTAVPGGMDTLFLEGPAPLGYDEAIARCGGGALVLNVLGVHTQDFSSGDFSLSAPQTLSIGASGIEGRVRGTISGNVFEILRSTDLALVRFPGEHTPGLLVRCRLDLA
jgi:PmbA protein